jgi:hypothetical protein
MGLVKTSSSKFLFLQPEPLTVYVARTEKLPAMARGLPSRSGLILIQKAWPSQSFQEAETALNRPCSINCFEAMQFPSLDIPSMVTISHPLRQPRGSSKIDWSRS